MRGSRSLLRVRAFTSTRADRAAAIAAAALAFTCLSLALVLPRASPGLELCRHAHTSGRVDPTKSALELSCKRFLHFRGFLLLLLLVVVLVSRPRHGWRRRRVRWWCRKQARPDVFHRCRRRAVFAFWGRSRALLFDCEHRPWKLPSQRDGRCCNSRR